MNAETPSGPAQYAGPDGVFDSQKEAQLQTELGFLVIENICGYTRVSTATQGRDGNSLEEQVAALEKYGCQKIVKEAFTGKTMDRPKFLSLLEELQEGDTLVVCKAPCFYANPFTTFGRIIRF